MKDLNKRILVFAPHPDDETWGCGGTIAKKLREGYEVIIVVMTDGRNAFSQMLGIHSDPTADELKEIRKKETIRSAKILGVPERNVVFLEFEDGKLGENAYIGGEAEEKVVEMLRKHQPTEVYFPYERDYHPDHRATNRIVKHSIKKLGISPAKYKYSILQGYARIGPIIDAILNVFKNNIVKVDISELLPLKERALMEFKSEFTTISPRQKKPLVENFSKILKKKEAFYLDE